MAIRYPNDGTGRDSYVPSANNNSNNKYRPPMNLSPSTTRQFSPPFLLERMAKQQVSPCNVLTHAAIPMSSRSAHGANRYNETPPRTLELLELTSPHKLPPCVSPGKNARPPLAEHTNTETTHQSPYSVLRKGGKPTTTAQANDLPNSFFTPSLRIKALPPGYGGHRRGDVATYTCY